MSLTKSVGVTVAGIIGLSLAFLAVLAWLVVGDPISQAKWNKVRAGMTKQEVLNILGLPDSLDGNQLQYSSPLNVGWVEFAFDENGLLLWKNDESAFGSLR